MKHNQRMYKQLMILFVTGMLFTGCTQKADGVEPVPTETVSEEAVESTEVESIPAESESIEIESISKMTVDSEVNEEQRTEVEGELNEEDVNLPVVEECEYILSFKESNDEIVNLVYAQENYESKRGFTCTVDMDRDGNVETFVMIPLYKGLISNNGNNVYLLELKREDNTESILRCVLEIYTYYKQLQHNKFLTDFYLSEKSEIIPAILVFRNSKQHCQFMSESKNVKALMKKLGVKIFTIKPTYSITEAN